MLGSFLTGIVCWIRVQQEKISETISKLLGAGPEVADLVRAGDLTRKKLADRTCINGAEPMSFKSWQDAETRLRTPEKLAPQEVRDLFVYMNQLSITGERRLTAELALQNIEAVQQFENSSSRLTRWLVGLTVALVLLTIVIAAYTVILARSQRNESAHASPMTGKVMLLQRSRE